jgi:TonB family protein
LPEGIERTAYTQSEVDIVAGGDPHNRPPRYPQALRDRNVIGNVRLQFIVDSAGVMDPLSVRVLFATAPEFVDAIRAVIPDWKFFSAKRAGRLVRQLVCMPFEFRLSDVGDSKELDLQSATWRTHPQCPTFSGPRRASPEER